MGVKGEDVPSRAPAAIGVPYEGFDLHVRKPNSSPVLVSNSRATLTPQRNSHCFGKFTGNTSLAI
jgi:hypothetical protein